MIEQVASLVDAEIGVSDWMTVGQDRISMFADATGDHQWIHVDEEKAASGPFGATIAHGFLTLSLLPELALMPEVTGVGMAINYGVDRVRFITPVVVGSNVRARSVLKEATEIKGGIHLKTEVTVEIEGSDRPALVAETLTRYYA